MGEIPDEGNLEMVLRQDKIMKETYMAELGEDFETYDNGVCTGVVKYPIPKAEKEK
jgi:hypothetical protein